MALGLTIQLGHLTSGELWLQGMVLALALTFVARPLAAGPLLLLARLRMQERVFVLWGGVKGAVPILLGAFVLLEAVENAARIYDIVFLVVTFSVVVQAASIPFVAKRLGIPMREVEGRRHSTVPGYGAEPASSPTSASSAS